MKKIVIVMFVAAFLPLSNSVFVQAQCRAGLRAKAVAPNDSLNYYLPSDVKFKIKMDNALKSNNYRTGDIIKFTVVENVYGLYKGKNRANPNAPPIADEMKTDELLLVIPKGTQGFGRVNYAKLKSSFYYRGKAKIYVVPEIVQTDDGRCFDIRIAADAGTVESPQNIKPCKYQSSELKKGREDKSLKKTNDEDTNGVLQCIEGRREKNTFATGLVGALGTGALALVKDNSTSAVAGLTLINSASSNTGISSFLSGRDSEINDSLIFEVELVHEENGYIKGEAPKKEEKKP